MKALTISQPFASLIADGKKFVENRTWETLYRGPLAIHAGKGTQYLSRSTLATYPTGCVIAVARLAGCFRRSSIEFMASSRLPPKSSMSRTWREIFEHEHTEGPFCWILEDVRKLAEPIPFRGAQGLFDIPDGLLAKFVGVE